MSDAHESGAEAFGGLQGRSFGPQYEVPSSLRIQELERRIKFWAAELRILSNRLDLPVNSADKLERVAREMLKEVGLKPEELHARPR